MFASTPPLNFQPAPAAAPAQESSGYRVKRGGNSYGDEPSKSKQSTKIQTARCIAIEQLAAAKMREAEQIALD